MKPLSSEERYQELAVKWLNNTINPDEREEFAQWYNAGQDNDIHLPENFAGSEKDLKKRIYSRIDNRLVIHHRKGSNLFQRWYSVAAIILIILSTGLYFYSNRTKVPQVAVNQPEAKPVLLNSGDKISRVSKSKEKALEKNDIEAGDNKAILTLGDGRRIILDDARNGILANQDGNSILKTADGELIYTFIEDSAITPLERKSAPVIYNTIETPKGGKFQIKLPDGSRVWLNAASSLRFPTVFTGSKRKVELIGEAYFEVSPDQSKIFEVNTRDQIVQVLGTHFNINAYPDEPSVNTTLLEGSVMISDLRTKTHQLLKPGEQSKVNEKIEIINLKNTGEAVAWKDGYFQFNEADIQMVMRQIERWYDVSVVYEGAVPAHLFGGEIERSLSLLQVLKILEKTKVHFRLEGREVIVMP